VASRPAEGTAFLGQIPTKPFRLCRDASGAACALWVRSGHAASEGSKIRGGRPVASFGPIGACATVGFVQEFGNISPRFDVVEYEEARESLSHACVDGKVNVKGEVGEEGEAFPN